jgi:predicted nucleotidyltransferase
MDLTNSSKINEKDFTFRYGTLIRIREKLISEFENRIYCAIAYGSTLCEDFCCNSDFDILIFFKEETMENLKKLRKIKEDFLLEKITIDFNVHSKEEIPQVRKDCFWHNNRSLYFQKELTLYGLVLIGESPFLHNNFNERELKKESLRVVNSLLYGTRKYLINKNLDKKERITLMKWCIYSVLYALSFQGIITKTKTEALELFHEYYSSSVDPRIFLKAKKEETISDEMLEKAYVFLKELDSKLFSKYGEEYNECSLRD